MRKLKLIALFLVSVLFLSGCGAKTLKCEGKMEGMETTLTSEFDGKGDFQKAEMVMSYEVTDEILKVMSIDDLKKTFKESLEDTMKGTEVKVTDNGKDKITISLTLDKKSVKEISGIDKVETYDELKKSLEKQEFTCK